MIDREQEQWLTEEFVKQNLAAAVKAALNTVGINMMDEIVEQEVDVWSNHVEFKCNCNERHDCEAHRA